MSASRKASAEIRLLILDAIKDTHRRFLDPNTPSRRFLDHWDITEEGFFSRLADDLADYEIFLKPKDKPSCAGEIFGQAALGGKLPDNNSVMKGQ